MTDSTIPSPADTLDIALSLARAGWHVFPVRLTQVERDGKIKRDKRPLVKWHEGATTDAETIATWWTADFPDAWIGVHAARSGILIVDIDLEPDDGAANLKAAGIKPPRTFRYPTRGGGNHRVYAAPDGVKLTIGQGVPVKGVDVRAGTGLMVYYGPKLDGPPVLAPAPEWALIPATSTTTDRSVDADLARWISRTVPGDPTKPVRKVLKRVKPDGMGHEEMLAAVTDLVKLGASGTPGVGNALTAARATYLRDYPESARHWDNAVLGSIQKFGSPPATLELTKPERQAIAQRNTPAAVAERKTERTAAYVSARIEAGDHELTDAALAEAMALELVDEWVKVPGVGLLRYDGTVWTVTDEEVLIEVTRRILRRVRADETRRAILAGDKQLIADARALESRTHVVAIARFTAGILAERGATLDADPDVLNVRNGVVELRTGNLRERRATDYFTKVTGCEYHPGATSRDWSLALEALPKKTRKWVQVRLGQAATGRISADKSIPFFVGGGDNGKSVVIGAVREALGNYAVTVPERLLLGSDQDHPTDIMTLEGARLAVFEELPRGGRLNAQRIKLLAGTNELSGRRMRMDFRTFKATHTLVGATNHLPVITDVDDAIWNRVAPVPFPFKFVAGTPRPGTQQRQGDEGLRDRLADVADPAVLAWLIEGAVASYQVTPEKPPAVVAALEEWRGDADPVLGFVRDKLTLDADSFILATDLYAEFGRYIESRGQQRWSDQLIANSFIGHSAMEGVEKRQRQFAGTVMPSRPLLASGPTPKRAIVWEGVRFGEDTVTIPASLDVDELNRRDAS